MNFISKDVSQGLLIVVSFATRSYKETYAPLELQALSDPFPFMIEVFVVADLEDIIGLVCFLSFEWVYYY
jgi:hypothetical protein